MADNLKLTCFWPCIFIMISMNMNASDNRQNKTRTITLIIVAAAYALLVTFSASGAVKLYRLKAQMKVMSQKISVLETKNDNLNKIIPLLRDDPDTIKRAIRKRLGKVKRDEIIYSSSKETPDSSDTDSQ